MLLVGSQGCNLETAVQVAALLTYIYAWQKGQPRSDIPSMTMIKAKRGKAYRVTFLRGGGCLSQRGSVGCGRCRGRLQKGGLLGPA